MVAVSVILIAYNVEHCIYRAVESVLNQTLQEVELICVDDCSTDTTPKLLAQYAQRDPRVRVLRHTENMGPAAARYTGLQASTGRFVMFLDGDDALVPNACDFLYREIQRQNVELLSFNTILQPDTKTPPTQQTLDFLKNYLTVYPQPFPHHNGQLLDLCFGEGKLSWNLWNKMYARELIVKAYSQYRGERLTMAEDMLITFMVLLHARSYGYTDQAFYCYRVGNGISTRSTLSLEQMSAYAQEYKVWMLLCQWLTPQQKKWYARPLQFIHASITNTIFHIFLREATPQDCPQYLTYLLEYYPLQEFTLDLIDKVYTQHFCSPTQAISRLRGCEALSPTKRPIRTIGNFYFRMNNGGVERVISLLAPIWQALGYRVVIITEQPPCPQDYAVPNGVERIIIPPVEGKARARAETWHDLIKTHQIDVMVYHAWVNSDLILDEIAIRSAGIPFVLYAHNIATQLFDVPYLNPFLQEADYGLCSRILAMSDVDAAWWNALGLPTNQILNPPTYTADQIQPSPLNNHDVLWVGRLSPEKQPYHAFDIAKLVHKAIPDFRLRVVGAAESSEETMQFVQYLEDNQMTEYVLLEGFHADPAPFYSTASALLCTSQFEGYAMIFAESKAFGLPLVTYELSNLHFVRQDQGMLVVPQGDRRTAANQLIRLLSDKDLRRTLGQQARSSIEHATTQDIAAQWVKIFSTLHDDTIANRAPLYHQPPLQVAVRLAMRSAWKGAEQRMTTPFSPTLDQLQQENAQLAHQNAEYAETVKELTHSHIFLVGRIVTWPLRKLKQLLRKLH